ncbi:MAG: 30S ribosomal protein S17 [Alphaproteobacteria bacterium]
MKAKIVKVIDEKTIKAVSTTYKKHEKYGKFITTSKNFMVDTNNQKVEVGQEIEIINSRPVSKTKKWKIK